MSDIKIIKGDGYSGKLVEAVVNFIFVGILAVDVVVVLYNIVEVEVVV